ncbi:MAG TPA: hypothetical protein VK892_03480 [Pyrinomonadaceae bacterium]|nr:hypothetical protein [Pyrinomonadaceae bacterium]
MTVIKLIIGLIFLLTLALASAAQAQNNPYPNELQGFEFFGKGKLKGLKLGVSTKETVKRVFGEGCEYFCDYDADWTVTFSYYEIDSMKEDSDENGKKTVYYIDSKYLYKLRSIELRPKKQISLVDYSFSNAFEKQLKRQQLTHTEKGRGRMITYELFQDSFGLTYQLFGKTGSDAPNNEKAHNKGDLSSVLYFIPKEEEKKMFTLQKN